ncbi:TPA: hypothetical protein N0F65_010315 [Lagenidium giganteum]|uniref:DNA2/NAM7 helicase-like C-terminal domain-containing protein n=1 Tax=Lagenidium giganteum TaxID=4803 RepID=A0AAV2Z8C6_9STRA|nr:TPA: hypothetical protein N0F65_010315 [Lagenidium giganteum]
MRHAESVVDQTDSDAQEVMLTGSGDSGEGFAVVEPTFEDNVDEIEEFANLQHLREVYEAEAAQRDESENIGETCEQELEIEQPSHLLAETVLARELLNFIYADECPNTPVTDAEEYMRPHAFVISTHRDDPRRSCRCLVKRCETRGREEPGIQPHLFSGAQQKAAVGMSRINPHEAEMVCKLALYLSRCGVPHKSLAILTPYRGQLLLMRKTLLQEVEMVEELAKAPSCILSTVDRFQGDEADVVIVSLVNRKTPFEKLRNRMIVLLSRARIEMYIVGNATDFRESQHWQTVMEVLSRPAPSDSAKHLQRRKRTLVRGLEMHCRYAARSIANQLPLQMTSTGRSLHHMREVGGLAVPPTPTSASLSRSYQCELGVVEKYDCDVQVSVHFPRGHDRQIQCWKSEILLKIKSSGQRALRARGIHTYPTCKHQRTCSCAEYTLWTNRGIEPPSMEPVCALARQQPSTYPIMRVACSVAQTLRTWSGGKCAYGVVNEGHAYELKDLTCREQVTFVVSVGMKARSKARQHLSTRPLRLRALAE